MFDELTKYKDEKFYKENRIIRFTTVDEDAEYEIFSSFYSRVFYQDENGVFRYYYFINAYTENEYKEFVKNAKEASLYDTGVTPKYCEPLMTLSTCDYNEKNGRFIVVAKKVRK